MKPQPDLPRRDRGRGERALGAVGTVRGVADVLSLGTLVPTPLTARTLEVNERPVDETGQGM